MNTTGSTMLRRTVAVAAVAGACVAAAGTVLVLVPLGDPPPGAPPGPDGIAPRRGDVPETVDELLAQLRSANAAFDAPTSMTLGDVEELELVVSRRRSIEDLEDDIDDAGGQVEGEQIRVSEAMEAALVGNGFDIRPITPAVQLVAGAGVTRWAWSVEPSEHGEQRLHLTLSALFTRNGVDRPYTIRTFARTLEVEVSLQERVSGFVEDHWEWLWATLLVPAAGWALRRRRGEGGSTARTTARAPSPLRAGRARSGRHRRARGR